jgi:proline iminopeptidase
MRIVSSFSHEQHWTPGAGQSSTPVYISGFDSNWGNTPMRSFVVALMFVSAAVANAAAPLPDDGFVDVPGGRVAFRVVGKSDGIPVLVIHGGPGSSGCLYVGTMAGVAASRPVVTYDQLGSGNSDRMVDLQRDGVLPRFVAEVAAIRQQLGLREVHLVGHSWGAAVALEYLLTGDNTGVRSVTFVGPFISTPRWIEDAGRRVQSLPKDAQDAIVAAKASGKYDTSEFKAANEAYEGQFLARTPMDQWRIPECESAPVEFNADVYEQMWGPSEFVVTGTLRDYDRIQRLSEVKVPTLFLIGEYDEVLPATIREYQARVPGSIVKVVPDAAHMINVDQPQAFSAAIAEFVSSVDKR